MSVEIIAEISSNHGGDLVLAKEFIHACAEHGADWVKFQTTRVAHLSPADPQYAWFAKSELSDEAHYDLKAECEKAGVKFLTTVFNAAEIPFLLSLGLSTIKIGSGEANCHVLLRRALDNFSRVIRSLELGTHAVWYDAVKDVDRSEVLSCITRYPASVRACEAAIDCIGYYNVVGYSDHAVGVEMAKWAMERGATVIEKHVQLPNQARPPKPYEATMAELRELRQFADENPQRFVGRWQYA